MGSILDKKKYKPPQRPTAVREEAARRLQTIKRATRAGMEPGPGDMPITGPLQVTSALKGVGKDLWGPKGDALSLLASGGTVNAVKAVAKAGAKKFLKKEAAEVVAKKGLTQLARDKALVKETQEVNRLMRWAKEEGTPMAQRAMRRLRTNAPQTVKK